MPPGITVTLAELARAFDQIGLTESVSATRLYRAFFNCNQQGLRPSFRVSQITTSIAMNNIQRISPAATGGQDQGSPIQSREVESNVEVLSHKEIRRRMLEMAKASFPDGIPSPYVVIDTVPHPSK